MFLRWEGAEEQKVIQTFCVCYCWVADLVKCTVTRQSDVKYGQVRWCRHRQKSWAPNKARPLMYFDAHSELSREKWFMEMAKFDTSLQSHKEIYSCMRCFFLFFWFFGAFFREQFTCTAFSSGVAPKGQYYNSTVSLNILHKNMAGDNSIYVRSFGETKIFLDIIHKNNTNLIFTY